MLDSVAPRPHLQGAAEQRRRQGVQQGAQPGGLAGGHLRARV